MSNQTETWKTLIMDWQHRPQATFDGWPELTPEFCMTCVINEQCVWVHNGLGSWWELKLPYENKPRTSGEGMVAVFTPHYVKRGGPDGHRSPNAPQEVIGDTGTLS